MKNILIIEDISSFGKCSTTVALPIISACGSTGSVLPTSILSTHTGPSFSNYVVLDLFDHMKATVQHWEGMGIQFDAIYTGYLGKIEHIDFLVEHLPILMKKDGKLFVDPAFGDNGEFYPGFETDYALAYRELIAMSDYVMPNYTEVCFILEKDYQSLTYTDEELESLLVDLEKIGAKTAIITGVRKGEEIGAVLFSDDGKLQILLGEYIHRDSHGTGDVFASVVVGEYMRDFDIERAVLSAVNFVIESIKQTQNDSDPIDYGVHFEKALHQLIRK